MTKETLGSAIDGLESVYESIRAEDERYAKSEKAIPVFIDERYGRLCRFYSCLEMLRTVDTDPFGANMVQQINIIRRADPELNGVFIIVTFRPGGNNYSQLTYNLYVDSAN